MALERCNLTADTSFQYRLARSVSSDVQRLVTFVCQSNQQVRACYLLDVRKPDSSDVRLGIAVLADDQIEMVIDRFISVFDEYPETERHIIIFPANHIAPELAGHEFYTRDP